ncbi:cell division protein FtsQ/DivIB [Pseudogracilibacillus auburnensis]|uniref:cell division protein FtsQ/DivIB n=1 Tax=Pseudogracilibacillus auburnensis TaxID=1494959 RepID=UPI001A97B956|nr:FtsQ-type POTRA domain-containing protein [Pseudogracilibacillus auburnensis]MBO1004938.1 FtsQ-type POTRA domain-containing protein [Pseudogracilibacillus auburnensis]
MQKGKVLSLEERIPQIKQLRRRKANRRLIFLLSLFFLLIAFVVYFQSPFSQIHDIKVIGNESIPEKSIISISGIHIGDNIWKMDKKNAEKSILSLPEVKAVDIRLIFPNKLEVKLVERSVVAFIASKNQFFPILDNGVILHKNRENVLAPILTSFTEGTVLNELVSQLKELPDEILNAISEIHYDPKETDQYHIYLFMNDGYEVNATIPTLSEKLVHYPSIISQLNPKIKGVIDIEVGSFFKAYETEGEEMIEEDER